MNCSERNQEEGKDRAMDVSKEWEKQADRYVIEIVLSCMGVVGILSTLISSALPLVFIFNVSVCACFFCTIWIICIDVSKISKSVKLVVAAGILLFWVPWVQVLYNGFISIINSCIVAIEKGGNLDLSALRLSEAQMEQAAKSLDQTVAILFLACILSFLISMIVVKWHSMAAAVISILPMFVLFVSFSVIPSTMSFICCTLYVFGVAAIAKKEESHKPVGMMLIASWALALALVLLIPKGQFSRLPIFVKSGRALQTVISGCTGGSFDFGVAGSALNAGILGKIDSIKYNQQDVMTVKTIDTGNNQYIAKFTGDYYKDNRWTRDLDQTTNKWMLVKLADDNKSMQNYIDGNTGDYYNQVKEYKRYELDASGKPISSKDCYYVDPTTYAKFKNIADQTVKLGFLYSPPDVLLKSGTGLQGAFGDKEKDIRKKATQNYTEVPDYIKQMLNGLVGSVSISTEEQKEAYINYVKDYLAANYSYTSRPGMVPSGKDFVKYFLMDSKQGYCTYFATAATLMLRNAGIPARYVEGYVVTESQLLGGEKSTEEIQRDTDGGGHTTITYDAYTVTVNDTAAHAWVEVYMDGYGWEPIEVTPGSSTNDSTAVNNSAIAKQSAENDSESVTDAQTEATTETTESSTQESITADDNDGGNNIDGQNGDVKLGYWSIKDWVAVVGNTLLACFIIAVLIVFFRYYRLRKKLLDLFQEECTSKQQRSKKVLAMYAYFERLMQKSGFKKPNNISDETYAEYLCSLNSIFVDHDIKTVIDIVMRAGFGQAETTDLQSYEKVKMEIQGIRKELVSELKWWKRLLLQYIYVL